MLICFLQWSLAAGSGEVLPVQRFASFVHCLVLGYRDANDTNTNVSSAQPLHLQQSWVGPFQLNRFRFLPGGIKRRQSVH